MEHGNHYWDSMEWIVLVLLWSGVTTELHNVRSGCLTKACRNSFGSLKLGLATTQSFGWLKANLRLKTAHYLICSERLHIAEKQFLLVYTFLIPSQLVYLDRYPTWGCDKGVGISVVHKQDTTCQTPKKIQKYVLHNRPLTPSVERIEIHSSSAPLCCWWRSQRIESQ